MPLFIDLHIDRSLTPDLITKCHVADKAIQDKYGVRYLQILLNQPQGYLFCLVEGPDKESCAKVHQEAHGNIACNILEITQSDFSALLANKGKDRLDFTLNQDGTLDTGNRAILAMSLLGSTESRREAREIIKDTLQQEGGRSMQNYLTPLIAFFDSSTSAVKAALIIRQKIKDRQLPVEVRIGIDIGPPLKEKGNFFEDALRSAERLSFVSASGQIAISSTVMQLYHGNSRITGFVMVINPPDQKFLNQVIDCTEKLWENNNLTITDFAREMGMSKSQFTRRLRSAANFSPNDFLKEFRLRKALRLMEDQEMNVAEITMAIGFSNPSYFTKCFRKRFGKAPSEYMITA